jgi:hypothetical protein
MSDTTIDSVSRNITIQQVQPSYTAYDMGTIPANTAVSKAISNVMEKQITYIQEGWPASFPEFMRSQCVSDIIAGDINSSAIGIPSPAFVEQITRASLAWNFPLDRLVAEQIARQMSTKLVEGGRFVRNSYDTVQMGPNQTLSYGFSEVIQVINSTTVEEGIIYSLAVALDLF